ncbi:hypothetical protein ADUPG1_004609, partial [Aduncisulcus paluster]
MESVTISGLPDGVEIVGATENADGSFTIKKADDLENGFTVNEKNGIVVSIDFIIKYEQSTDEDFEMKISGQSKFSMDN